MLSSQAIYKGKTKIKNITEAKILLTKCTCTCSQIKSKVLCDEFGIYNDKTAQIHTFIFEVSPEVRETHVLTKLERLFYMMGDDSNCNLLLL